MSPRLSLTAVCAAVVASAIAAAPATANTFCAPAPCVEGTPKTTIEEAVKAADDRTGPDVVAIGGGTFSITPDAYGQGLMVGAKDTEIRGAGRDATILTSGALPSSAGYTRTLVAGYVRRLSDLTLRLPSAVTPGHNSSVEGAHVYDGLVERVRIDAVGATFGPEANDGQALGLTVNDGEIRDVVVDLPRDADTQGLRLGHINSHVTIDGMQVSAKDAVHSSPQTDADQPVSTMTATRMHIHGGARALSVSDGAFALSDSVVELATGDEAAVSVYAGRSPSPAGMTMDRVTLLGPGTAGSAALANGGHDPATTTTLRARHLLVAGFGSTLRLERGGGRLVTAVDHSALPKTIAEDGTDGVAETSFDAIREGDPLLTGGGQPTVRAGSPAVDVGGEPLLWPLPAFDLLGAPRLHDGDGDGTALVDAGALEYQGGPPVTSRDGEGDRGPGAPPAGGAPTPPATGQQTTPARDVVAPRIDGLRLSTTRLRLAPAGRKPRALTVRYTLGEAATVTLQIQRRARGRKGAARWVTVQTSTRAQAAGARSLRSAARVRPGAHRVVVLAVDAAGNRGAARTAAFRVVR